MLQILQPAAFFNFFHTASHNDLTSLKIHHRNTCKQKIHVSTIIDNVLSLVCFSNQKRFIPESIMSISYICNDSIHHQDVVFLAKNKIAKNGKKQYTICI